ncbi:hypothetical protein MPSEU_000369400 [Mayamaea pseudoterrestris]|nr:hypothetical protein MPSEU_000369400 [Mayamaea pseudoterrestris]
MTTNQHTYLRYECADTFGLIFSSGSSKAPPSNAVVKFVGAVEASGAINSSISATNSFMNNLLAATTGSSITLYNTKTSLPVWRFFHYQELAGGVGTGRAWNNDEVVCFDTHTLTNIDAASISNTQIIFRLASGWVDGAIRIWTVTSDELLIQRQQNLIHSLLNNEGEDGNDHREPPLVLNGHNQSPVRTLSFDGNGGRLASGGSYGSVVLWDVVAETGLFRLLGHVGGITQVMFLELTGLDLLVTTSLDGLIKVWDLAGQCCIQTLANHRGEVIGAAIARLWSNHTLEQHSEFGVEKTEFRRRLITGGSDGQVRVWSLQTPTRVASNLVADSVAPSNLACEDVCQFMGMLPPPPNVAILAEKIQSLHFHPSGKYVGVLHGNSKSVDVYIVRSAQESTKKRQRRLRRREEKDKKRQSDGGQTAAQKRGMLDDLILSDDEHEALPSEEQQLDPSTLKASDEFEHLSTIHASHKVRNFAFAVHKERGEMVRVVCALTTNAYETFSISRVAGKEGARLTIACNKIASMDTSGHPTGIRAVSLSSDDNMACTVSKNTVKIWNVRSRTCIQSLSPNTRSKSKLAAAYGLCVVFLPGNRHVVVGTREGHLLVIDIAAGEVVFLEEKAHESAVWSVDVRKPTTVDGSITLVSGGAKEVKFWDVEASGEQSDGEEGIGHDPVLVHTRSLKMSDEVIAVRYSHAQSKRLVCVASLDCTVKVFFEDSLKLFLSLYGHKLPVLAIDCSDDDALLASASADKTIKIHGLDFGDTHRTLHGHEDSITDVRFVRRTHNFFSTSKDGSVRYWDGDRFEQILALAGHTAEVNSVAISRTGAFVLTCGMDRQVRVWERTKDIVFLQEERERELEQVFDRIGSRDDSGTVAILHGKANLDSDDKSVDDDNQPQSEAAVKKSVMTISAGDRLMDGLERADQELKEVALFRNHHQSTRKMRQLNPLLMGMLPAHYVLWILKSIKNVELEQSLLVLSHSHVERLIYYCAILLKQGRGVETCSKVAIFLVKVHQWQVVANKSLAIPLRELRHQLRLRLAESRDIVGYNLAALKLIGRMAQDQKSTFIGGEESQAMDIWAGMGIGRDVAAAAAAEARRNNR